MSSKRRIRRRSCTYKVRHGNFKEAMSHVREAGGFPYHTYKCKFCGGYHVGRYSQFQIKILSERMSDKGK